MTVHFTLINVRLPGQPGNRGKIFNTKRDAFKRPILTVEREDCAQKTPHKNHQKILGGWSLETIARQIERFIILFHRTPTIYLVRVYIIPRYDNLTRGFYSPRRFGHWNRHIFYPIALQEKSLAKTTKARNRKCLLFSPHRSNDIFRPQRHG